MLKSLSFSFIKTSKIMVMFIIVFTFLAHLQVKFAKNAMSVCPSFHNKQVFTAEQILLGSSLAYSNFG